MQRASTAKTLNTQSAGPAVAGTIIPGPSGVEGATVRGRHGGGLRLVLCLIVALAAAGMAAFLMARRVDRNMRNDLMARARLAEQLIGGRRAAGLSGSPADLDSPIYRDLKERLILLRRTIPQCRVLYLMGRTAGGRPFFYVDSEPAGSKDESPPGRIYREVTPLMRAVFETGREQTDGPTTDHWGTFVTALVPLPVEGSGESPVIFGMDVEARTWREQIFSTFMMPIGSFLLLTLAGLSIVLLRANRRVRAREHALAESEERYRGVFENSFSGIVVQEPVLDEEGRVSDYRLQSVNQRFESHTGLRAEQAFSARLLDTVADTIILFDPETGWPLRWNAVFARRSGYTDGEIARLRAPDDWCAKEDRAVLTAAMDRLRRGENVLLEMSLRTKDGRLIPTEYSVSMLATEADGLLQWVMAVGRDISERVANEEALRAAARQWQTTFDSVRDVVWLLSTNMRIVSGNRAGATVLGLKTEEIVGKHCYEIVHGTTGPIPGCPVVQAAQSGRRETVQLPLRGRWMEVSADPVCDAMNRQIGTVHLISDITARRQTEEELQASEARFRALVEQAGDGFALLNRDGRYLDVNTATCRQHGYTREEILLLGIADIDPTRTLETFRSEFDDLVRTAVPYTFTSVHRRRDGSTFPVEATVSSVEIGGIPRVQAQFRDISERQRADADSARARRLEAVGQLAAGIAHEINTPTQFVGDNLQFLKDAFAGLCAIISAGDELVAACESAGSEPALTERRRRLAAEVDEAFLLEEVPRAVEQSLEGVGRVARIVRAMKEFSHPGGADKEPANVNDAVETTVTVARNEWKYVADVEIDLSPDLPPLVCLIGELKQVLLNLIVNAAQAIEAAGVKERGEKGLIRVSTRRDGEAVEIRVSDTGTGIAEEHRSRIFEQFYTTKGIGKGTGLGLAMAYQVMTRKHNGTIRFETEVGRGTTFILRLPLDPGSTVDSAAAAAA